MLHHVENLPQWQAHLALDFARQQQRTIITRRQHHGPLVIQKPFYPEGGPCHIYLLHPPGGLVGGDSLVLHVNLNADCHTLITTPGAAKFYRSAGLLASQRQHFSVADNALLEWLPQESIAFDNTLAQVNTHVELTRQARFIGWEITCLGRIASQEVFLSGKFSQKLTVLRETKPVLIERALFQGGSELLSMPWGLANHPTVGTMIVTPANRDLLEKVRSQVNAQSHELFSATVIDDVMVCRYLGPQAETAKQLFTKVWQVTRPMLQNIEACLPRIWNT